MDVRGAIFNIHKEENALNCSGWELVLVMNGKQHSEGEHCQQIFWSFWLLWLLWKKLLLKLLFQGVYFFPIDFKLFPYRRQGTRTLQLLTTVFREFPLSFWIDSDIWSMAWLWWARWVLHSLASIVMTSRHANTSLKFAVLNFCFVYRFPSHLRIIKKSCMTIRILCFAVFALCHPTIL